MADSITNAELLELVNMFRAASFSEDLAVKWYNHLGPIQAYGWEGCDIPIWGPYQYADLEKVERANSQAMFFAAVVNRFDSLITRLHTAEQAIDDIAQPLEDARQAIETLTTEGIQK